MRSAARWLDGLQLQRLDLAALSGSLPSPTLSLIA
jgi:hypothetical protein